MTEGDERKEKINEWSGNGWEFSKSNDKHQSKNPRSPENTKQVHVRKLTPRHIIFKLQKIKDKENILKMEKHITYRGMRLRIAYDFSSETMQAVRERNEALKLLKEKNPANYNSVSSKTMLQKWMRNIFSDKQKLKEFFTNWPASQEMLNFLRKMKITSETQIYIKKGRVLKKE